MKWLKGASYKHDKPGGPTNGINEIVSSSEVELEEFQDQWTKMPKNGPERLANVQTHFT